MADESTHSEGTSLPEEPPAGERLDSWKEIAAYLKRDIRTLRRWEKEEGLPVHRHVHKKLASVYAYKAELDAWWNNRRPRLEAAEAEEVRKAKERQKIWLLAAGGAGVAVLLAIWVVARWREPAAPPTPARVMQLTTLPGLEDSPAWSADGRSIAYVSDAAGNLDIYVQQIGGGPAIRVTDSDADDAQPAWSPDGTRMAFVSARAYPDKRLSMHINLGTWASDFAGGNGDVWVMPVLGGAARRIAPDAYFPTWSTDGKKLVYQAFRGGVCDLWIQEVDAATEPQALGLDSLRQLVVTQPAWSPDGKWIAFVAGGPETLRIYVVPLEGQRPRLLTDSETYALTPNWSRDGRWLFYSSNRGGRLNLWKARFKNGRLTEPKQLTTGSGSDLYARIDPTGNRLIYTSMSNALDLYEHNINTEKATPLITETSSEDDARPSPDGNWVAFLSDRPGTSNLWLLNKKTGALTQVNTPPLLTAVPSSACAWSWDSKHLFVVTSEAIWRYEVATASSSKAYEGRISVSRLCVSADNSHLVLAQQAPVRGLYRVELASGRSELLLRPAQGSVSSPDCSRDGQWVAYHLEQGNKRKIWIVPYAGGVAKQLTFGDSEDSHPSWSPDSRLIYFARNHQDIYVVPRTGGEPKRVTRYGSFAITIDYPVATADGKSLVFTHNHKVGDIYILENPLD